MDMRGGATRQANARPALAGRTSYLSMYADQPNEEVTLEHFEICAFNRLKGEGQASRPARGAALLTRAVAHLQSCARLRPCAAAA